MKPLLALHLVLAATLLLLTVAPAHAQLVAAVLPSSRTLQSNLPSTMFATLINTGTVLAIGCTITAITPINATFRYFTVDPTTYALTSEANPSVTIAPGPEIFLLEFGPLASFPATDVQLRFKCLNTEEAPTISGLNTVLLSAFLNTSKPDIIVLAATPTSDGIVTITDGRGAFAVSTINIGSGETVTLSAVSTNAALPVSVTLCQTAPTTAACLQAPSATVTTFITYTDPPTYSIFVNATSDIPFLPALNRIVLKFRDAAGVTWGSTSVAVRTR